MTCWFCGLIDGFTIFLDNGKSFEVCIEHSVEVKDKIIRKLLTDLV